MKGSELLEKYPLAGNLITDWFLKQLLESLKVSSVDEEFKKFMREQSLDNEKMGIMIDANPRMLLDVFDENDIIIYFIIFSTPQGVKFSGAIHTGNNEVKPNPIGKQYNTRKEAELFAIEAAFEILEEQLTPKEETNENV
jgi:hypothetical protein